MHWLSVSRKVLTFQQGTCMRDLVFRFKFPVCVWVVRATGVTGRVAYQGRHSMMRANCREKFMKIVWNSAQSDVANVTRLLFHAAPLSLCDLPGDRMFKFWDPVTEEAVHKPFGRSPSIQDTKRIRGKPVACLLVVH